ncbi:F0F1 ATP synthase subunit epsilon [Weissella thailandensis]|uniref:ATP synthase epsilon chain n=1 Tax=Weissella thailandensis TaxID=89061 RepID=A0ABX9I430_9LACO|nr:F0F1 ATP synthase subunit epsilon [Weissella thailandensis]NKY90959.1 F0F1 ATP synthase subunit epsilon [Weissella thailandensis]RDS59465.1 F0F1 ATP synthase subunit epsilon [Weissella thailandensis]GEP74445.1 ATP synthase epsilon chain [Weissella thailandensis]
MSEHTLHVKVVTPDGVVFGHETASLVVLDTINGEEGIMANHAPIITSLHIGEVKIINEEESLQETVTISGGFAEFSENQLSIVSDSAERSQDIDVKRAEQAKERAEKHIAAGDTDDVERAQAALMRAVNRIHAVTGNK